MLTSNLSRLVVMIQQNMLAGKQAERPAPKNLVETQSNLTKDSKMNALIQKTHGLGAMSPV